MVCKRREGGHIHQSPESTPLKRWKEIQYATGMGQVHRKEPKIPYVFHVLGLGRDISYNQESEKCWSTTPQPQLQHP